MNKAWLLGSLLPAFLFAQDFSLQIALSGETLQLSWDKPGVLQEADDLNTGWTDRIGPVSPHEKPLTGDKGFFRCYALTSPLPDTGQITCYGATSEISRPAQGQAFSGQDAQQDGYSPSFKASQDGETILDEITGLTWTQSPDWDGDGVIDALDKLSWPETQSFAGTLNVTNYGGYNDWRLPSIKELYSLIDFRGQDPSGVSGTDTSGLIPFIDTQYFDFGYGDTDAGERIIDAQFWSATEYVSTTMNGDHTVFGVNFADGRIKGYGTVDPRTQGDKTAYVIFIRGNPQYGVNEFVDNADGTVTDRATGWMWQESDSLSGKTWEEALAYAESLSLGGHDDWRLPNAKELQSIVDYTRSPATHGTAAIDPVFNCSNITDEGGGTDFPFYWTSTTHANDQGFGDYAVYVCFGTAYGFMEMPPNSGNYTLLDVHGAGSQRSDPKSGQISNYTDASGGHGPQGDVIRITNYVRCVRGGALANY